MPASPSGIQQLVISNNIFLEDTVPNGTQGGFNIQLVDGAYFPTGTPTQTQNWNHNFYFLTTGGGYCNSGTCTGTKNPGFYQVNISCASPSAFANFAAWQSFGEDAGSSVLMYRKNKNLLLRARDAEKFKKLGSQIDKIDISGGTKED